MGAVGQFTNIKLTQTNFSSLKNFEMKNLALKQA